MKKTIFAILITVLMVSVVFCSLSTTAADTNSSSNNVNVNNPPPVIKGRPFEEFEFTYCTADPLGNSWYIEWDWGDGNSEEYGPYHPGETAGARYSWKWRGDFYVRIKITFIGGEMYEDILCLMKIRWFDSFGLSSAVPGYLSSPISQTVNI